MEFLYLSYYEWWAVAGIIATIAILGLFQLLR